METPSRLQKDSIVTPSRFHEESTETQDRGRASHHHHIICGSHDHYGRVVRGGLVHGKYSVQRSKVKEGDFGTDGHQFLVPARGGNEEWLSLMNVFFSRTDSYGGFMNTAFGVTPFLFIFAWISSFVF